MSKNYKHIRQRENTFVNHPIKLIYFFIGLAIGLCIASAIYFYQLDINPSQTTQTTKPKITETESPQQSVQNPLPPIFDFYQILPNMKVNVSEWEADSGKDNKEKIKPADEEFGIYILQIGSFKERDKASKVKAKLALIGIRADIQRVVIHGKDIRYRVRIGPYQSPEKFFLIRQQLVENNLEYILLKLKNK